MDFSKKQLTLIIVFSIIALISGVIFSITMGATTALSRTTEITMKNELENFSPALPTRIYDRNGILLAEFFGEENRKLIDLEELPKHIVYSLLSREDRIFYKHNGFNFKRTLKGVFGVLIGRNFGGGSTLTQQAAGRTFCDRRKKTYSRKIKELWYSFHMEEYYSKDQIIELYLNDAPFGSGTNGIDAASRFFFEHPAKDMTLGESAVLVTHLSNPEGNSIIKNPKNAKTRQENVLNWMVKAKYITKKERDEAFKYFWDTYNYTRNVNEGYYSFNKYKAPYFSENVRIELTELLLGQRDIYKDGYNVYTSLDMNYQLAAEKALEKGLIRTNRDYYYNKIAQEKQSTKKITPILETLSFMFGQPALITKGSTKLKDTKNYYDKDLNPILEMIGMITSNTQTFESTNNISNSLKKLKESQTVEGAIICIENHTGQVLAMVGGSDYMTKQYNRAVFAKVQPGSTIKPLYYSAAISERVITPATYISDTPKVYYIPGGGTWTPENYIGSWKGDVLVRTALKRSMNIPSIEILRMVGFEPAIDRISKLVGMYEDRDNEDIFPRVYPLALGIIQVAPIQMARAFHTFVNQGKAVDPISIIKITDRNGKIILDNDKLRLEREKENPEIYNVMEENEAYIMVDMLKSTVNEIGGTLFNRSREFNKFNNMPMAGKTGTTDNWRDAWTVGFSPYVTTAVWLGFDNPGPSLGRYITGATHAGTVWAEFMNDMHKTLPIKEFKKPKKGLVTLEICFKSGLIPNESCEKRRKEIFLSDFYPTKICPKCEKKLNLDEEGIDKVLNILMTETVDDQDISTTSSFIDLEEDLDFFDDYNNIDRDSDEDNQKTFLMIKENELNLDNLDEENSLLEESILDDSENIETENSDGEIINLNNSNNSLNEIKKSNFSEDNTKDNIIDNKSSEIKPNKNVVENNNTKKVVNNLENNNPNNTKIDNTENTIIENKIQNSNTVEKIERIEETNIEQPTKKEENLNEALNNIDNNSNNNKITVENIEDNQ